ncbi:MAG: hypothetical protein BAA04_08210 [Firmicutes bacterium ZCTH02-B6]|nr:MAG: hypothetical protein BAA04_08210 [Firmicutes bacterium ZCTH02-B6]
MSKDPRIEQLADILVNYSTEVKAGDHVLIRATPLARPLVEAIFRLVVRNGGYPMLQLSYGSFSRIFYEEATDAHLEYLNPIEKYIIEHSDVLIRIDAPENTRELTGVDPKKMQRMSRTNRPLQEYIMSGKVRWVICNYPTPSLAQDADMSVDEYADFLFGACNIDWRQASERMNRIKERFDAADEVRIVGADTDLTFSIKGRPGVVADGHYNMPDGEVFYAPHEKTTNGTIAFELPAIYGGREVQGIRLTFRDGKIVEATAAKGEDLLHKLLDTDEGARFLGEFGIGCNYGITRYTRDILFDEKIGGTIHLAVGAAYPECQGTNQSAIHWDMVKDLRQGGRIYLDGELVQENGRFLFLED